MEKASCYQYKVEPFSEDVRGNLSWGNLGNLILRCASLHAGNHGFGYSEMIASKQVWVLSRLIIEMDSLPKTNEEFSIKTWVDRVYRQFTDRHFSVLRPDGSAYGHATSIWSLINTETRQPADLTRLPDGGFSDVLIPDEPSPIAPMGRMRMKNPQLVARHRAAYTDLDINGHVNSIRYLELLLNSMPADAMKQRAVRRIEMAYCLESYWGDELDIYCEPDAANADHVLFEIRNAQSQAVVKGSVSF